MSRNTVIKAQAEVEAGLEPSERLRAPGGGDRPAVDTQPGLAEALDELVHPDTRSTPMSALRWTLKSTYELDRYLQAGGLPGIGGADAPPAARHGLLAQAPSKQNDGTSHPERDGQFGPINDLPKAPGVAYNCMCRPSAGAR